MAQHDYVIDNGPGLAVRTDINAMAAAIQSSNSGTVEPAAKVPGQVWFNTTTGQLQVRNSGNTAWSPIGGLSTDGLTLYLKEGTTTRGTVAAAGGATSGTIALRAFNNSGVQTALLYLDSAEFGIDRSTMSIFYANDSAFWFRKPDGNIRSGVYSYTGGSIDLRAHNTTSNTLANLLRVGADRQMYTQSYGFTINSDGTAGDVWTNHRVSSSRATRHYYNANGDWVLQQSDDNFASHFINILNYVRGSNIVYTSHLYQGNGLQLNGTGGSGNGLYNGTGDGASATVYNVMLRSWWGIGFPSALDGVNRIWFDCRSGRGTFQETLVYGNMYMASGTRYQQDGNIYFTSGMTAYGESLHIALGVVWNQRAGLYTGDVQDELNFPLGHSVITRGGTTPARNQTATIRLGVSIAQEYRHNNGTGAILGGTWRARGYFDDAEGGISGCLFQRTA